MKDGLGGRDASAGAPRPLPVVGGHLALDFANTVDDPLGPSRFDHLATYGDLVAWSRRAGAVTEDQAELLGRAASRGSGEAAAALRRGHELRDVLNEVFGAVADGTGDDVARWTRLRPFVVAAVASAELDAGVDPHRWSWSGSRELAVLLHPIAAAAADLLVSEDLHRLKRCAGCPWLFLDRSKNHSRRWCDMADCGTVVKTQRYVERRSAARRAAAAQRRAVPADAPRS
jgi:predicted RNA-binding Zn ribbon-like protein